MNGRGRAADADFERRVDAIGWGALLVALGAVLLLADAPEQLWLVVGGAVMLGMSALRAALGLPVVWFTATVGTGALVWGGAAVLGFPDAAAALALLAVGTLIVMVELMRNARPGLSHTAR